MVTAIKSSNTKKKDGLEDNEPITSQNFPLIEVTDEEKEIEELELERLQKQKK